MGGSVGKIAGKVAGGATRVGLDTVSGGLLEIGGMSKRAGGLVGGLVDGSAFGKNPSSPVVGGGSMSPMDMLTTSGGAPLLANIALGAKPDDALASYFGVSPDKWNDYKASLTPSEQESIKGLSTQLNEISSNTDMRNQAVSKLVTDFPNFMQSMIPQYKGIMDASTQAAAEQALHTTASKYAAGGNLSSGAMAEAMARTGAATAQENTQFGANLALQDWQNQYNNASALQNFQQKMLGQGSQQGFNAIQNALSGNRQVSMQNAGFANQQNMQDQATEQSMWNTVGQLGGTAIGMAFGGPMGGAVGNAIGGGLASGNSGFNASNRLNLGGANRYGSGF